MSRSYRKPWIVEHAWKYWGKRFASRKIRKIPLESLGSNMNYKKHYQQYDICDYKLLCNPNNDYYLKCCRK